MNKDGLLNAILDSATNYGIVVLDMDGNIVTWNAGAEHIFRYAEREAVGRPLALLFTPDDRARGIPAAELEFARRNGRAGDYRWHARKDGSCFWADGELMLMKDEAGVPVGFVKILRDRTDIKESEAEIARLARVDSLTGLANRAEFDARYTDMAAAASRHDQLLILLLVDLDHFKQVNDRFGHHAGDLLLQQVAARMRAVVRDTDFIARIGGDEFVVLQPDAGTVEAGGTLANKLIDTLARPFRVEHQEVRIGASIGIGVYPHDATERHQLLRKADLALYKVKSEARNGYQFFTQELDDKAHKRSRELAGVRRAADQRAFYLEYQPKVNAASGRTIAVEALLRCGDPALAGYPAAEIVELAVDAGLMEQIGLWVISQACSQTRRWQDAGLPGLKACVNLCAAELADAKLPEKIGRILSRTGLAAEDLIVEITERDAFHLGGSESSVLQRLRSQAILVALDDFGTGYSSLSYLAELPADMIKLDQSFLRNIPRSQQDAAIAVAIIRLAHALGLDVIVKGVETAEQAEFFRNEHCEGLQGFFFSPPLPPESMSAWLLEHGDAGRRPTAPDTTRASRHP